MIHVERLTADAFAPFGEVMVPDAAEQRVINAGLCTRFHAMGGVDVGDGSAVVSLFRSEPTSDPVRLSMMERHPLGAQAFWPLTHDDWLVVVAPDEGGRPGAPRAFRPDPGTGVVYAAGVWHHPLIVLARAGDFLVVDRDAAPGDNLEEAHYARVFEIG